MDSITQIVLGAAVAEAVAGKKMGGKAALWGAIAGTIPDLDVFLSLFNHPIDAALLHRGFSHSIVFACLAAPILGWLVHRLYKQKYEQKLWIKLFFLAIITHPMLDIFTNYGTEFFWPFSLRITFNTVFVLDPLYTIPFAVCLLTALFMRRENKWRSRLNYTGIIWSCTYLMWGVIVKLIILNNTDTYFKESNVVSQRTMVTPMPITSFYWMFLGEDDTNFYLGHKSIFGNYKSNELEVYPKNHKLLDELKWKGKDFSEQLKFISDNYYIIDTTNNAFKFYDLRFGSSCDFTNKDCAPIMGYGMVVDNGFVNKTLSERGARSLKNINFDIYWNKVFAKYE
jgi:inner membrane protein